MSTQVLLALADPALFKGMSDDEIDFVTEALVTEIASDPDLKKRLSGVISQSAADIIESKASAEENAGS